MSFDSDEPAAQERLTAIETLLSHLQHDIDKLNDALIDQQSQIDRLHELIEKVESMVDQQPEGPRDPREERPPHY